VVVAALATVVALVTVVAGCAGGSAETPANTLTDAEVADGCRLLFDGETPAGWRAFNGTAFPDTGWAVIDGALVVGATATDPDIPVGGAIVTTENFSSFDLRFEFKLSPVANSGVFYHVHERPGAAMWNDAPEFQVLDDQAYIDMGTMDMHTHLTGDNYDLQAASEKTLRPPGEWNEGRILVEGAHVEHWLNGQKTVEYEFGSPEWEALVAKSKFAPFPDYGRAASGPIGLQDHGRHVWYRNLKIKPLGVEPDDTTSGSEPAGAPAASEPVSLFNGENLDGWEIHGTERWYVEDGELVCESGPDAAYGYLATERSFRDFDLDVEFNQEADGNSGVFFRSSLDGVTVSGWQAEVAPPGLFTGGIYESYGRGWLMKPAPSLPDVRMGEWNTLRVRAAGDRVTTWLNGTEMVDLIDAEIGKAEGVIALQIHDGGGIKVRWRNLTIREIP